MITATNATKRFEDITAVDHICAEVKDGSVYGLIGSNGAGKSTFLRMLAGILQPDEGTVQIDGKDIFENIAMKERFFFISDEQFFFPNSTPKEMKNYYKRFYSKFDEARYRKLMNGFGLDENRKLRTFSKGMKKQVSVICGVCSGTDYLFCDETFDGLDPVVRQTVKSLFAEDVADRGLTPIIASHNLRELEDICDHVGLLHRGGILFSRDLDDISSACTKCSAFSRIRRRIPWKALTFCTRSTRLAVHHHGWQPGRAALQGERADPTFMKCSMTLEEILSRNGGGRL